MKFEPGLIFVNRGIEHRTIPGRLKPGDTLHQFRMLGHNQWYTPPISFGLILAAAKYQTEENNYPRGEGYEGGEKLLRAYREACEGSLEEVIAKIEEESRLAWTRREIR